MLYATSSLEVSGSKGKGKPGEKMGKILHCTSVKK
jgi:hypothetical protein